MICSVPAKIKSLIQPGLNFSLNKGTYQMEQSPTMNVDCEVRTLMIKNVPSACSGVDVCRVIDSLGFKGQYDYFHLPMRQKSKSKLANKGYAFVGFSDPSVSKRFAQRMQGFQWGSMVKGSQKVAMPAPYYLAIMSS